jgi:hypothetical protein
MRKASDDIDVLARSRGWLHRDGVSAEQIDKYVSTVAPAHEALTDVMRQIAAGLLWCTMPVRLQLAIRPVAFNEIKDELGRIIDTITSVEDIAVFRSHRIRLEKACSMASAILGKMTRLRDPYAVDRADITQLQMEIEAALKILSSTKDFDFGLSTVDLYDGCSCSNFHVCGTLT